MPGGTYGHKSDVSKHESLSNSTYTLSPPNKKVSKNWLMKQRKESARKG